ncbi:MAG: phosphoribosylglycinamide formyltransferase [Bdellovibrio sp.]
MKPLRVAIFASGTGSNAMALINKAKSFSPTQVEVNFVLSDKAQAPILAKAKNAGIQTHLVERKKDRDSHEKEILVLLKEHKIDWIFLAGYMRILTPEFLHQFAKWHSGASQVVNIHPSLLPAYPGMDSIAAAHKDRVKKIGVTIHLVDEGMDTGPILMQEAIDLEESVTLESLTESVHKLEHRMYTTFLENLVTGKQKTCYFEENT